MFPDRTDIKLTEAIVASDASAKADVTNTAIAASASSTLPALGKALTLALGVATLPFHWPVTLGLGLTTLLISAVALAVIHGVNHRSNFKSVISLLLKEYDLSRPETFDAAIQEIDAAVRRVIKNRYKGSLEKFLEACEKDPCRAFAEILSELNKESKSNDKYLISILLRDHSPEKVEQAIQSAINNSFNGSFIEFAEACNSNPVKAFRAVLASCGEDQGSERFNELVSALLAWYEPREVAMVLNYVYETEDLKLEDPNHSLISRLTTIDNAFPEIEIEKLWDRIVRKKDRGNSASKIGQAKALLQTGQFSSEVTALGWQAVFEWGKAK